MREKLPQLRRKPEPGIRRNLTNPYARQFRFQRLMKRRLDLDGVEHACQVFQRVKTFRLWMWIHAGVPMGVSPSGGSASWRRACQQHTIRLFFASRIRRKRALVKSVLG